MRDLNKVVPDEEYKPSGTTLFILSECNRKSVKSLSFVLVLILWYDICYKWAEFIVHAVHAEQCT